MAASVALFFMLNTMNVFAKLLSPTHSVIEVAFYRNAIAVAPFAVWIFLFGRRDLLKINSRPYGTRAALGDRHHQPHRNLQSLQVPGPWRTRKPCSSRRRFSCP